MCFSDFSFRNIFCVSMGKTLWKSQNVSLNGFFQGKHHQVPAVHEDLSISSSPQTPGDATPVPPLKRSKTEPFLTELNKSTSKLKQVIHPSQNFAEMYQTEVKKAIKEKVDQALVKFIICCGIPPHIIQKRHFRDFINALNGKYSPPSRSTFEDSLAPSYAAAI